MASVPHSIKVLLPSLESKYRPPNVAKKLTPFRIGEAILGLTPTFFKMVLEYRKMMLIPVSCYKMAMTEPTRVALLY